MLLSFRLYRMCIVSWSGLMSLSHRCCLHVEAYESEKREHKLYIIILYIIILYLPVHSRCLLWSLCVALC